jgi:hypothetical protein
MEFVSNDTLSETTPKSTTSLTKVARLKNMLFRVTGLLLFSFILLLPSTGTAAPSKGAIITSSPPNPSNSANAKFTFTSLDAGSAFECQLDGGGYSPCKSPVIYTGLSDGDHTFSVKKDQQTGSGKQPASYTWTVDTTPPDTAITAAPSGFSNSTTPSFSFTSTETSATFGCNLDNAGYSSCTTPVTYTSLAEGAHTFLVRSIDAAGNVDQTPASYAWTIDIGAPSNGILTATGENQQVTLTWSGFSDALSGIASYTVVYSTTGVPSSCSSGTPIYSGANTSYVHTGLTSGTAYSYRVCATDGAGNVSTGAIANAMTLCAYSVSPTMAAFGPSGGTGSVDIVTTSACAWNASSNVSWIILSSGTSGTGTGAVSYSIEPNPDSSSRSGTITIEGQVLSVTQSGANCSYSLSPGSQQFTASGGTETVSVTAAAGCDWTAVSNDPAWITILSGDSGSGSGTVTYAVSSNTGTNVRTGALTIAGQNFAITQEPSNPGGTIQHQATSGSHLNWDSGAGVMGWDHTVLPGADQILIVTTALNSNSGATVTGVTFNGSSLTQKAVVNPGWAEEAQLWYMVAPPAGTYRVEVSYSRGHYGLEARASTYTGVNQYLPFSNVATGGGTSAGPASVTVGSEDGELVIDGLAYKNGGIITADPNQTERYNQQDTANSHGASERAGASPAVTMSWSLQNSDTWAIIAASLRPAGNPPVETVSVSDDFNRADENPLSGGGVWADHNSWPPAQIVNNRIVGGTADSSSVSYRSDFMPTVDQWASIKILDDERYYQGVALRLDPSSQSCYFVWGSGTPSTIRITRWGSVVVSYDTGIVLHSGDVLKAEAIGTDPVYIKAYINGFLVYTYADSDAERITTARRVGVHLWGTANGSDDFKAGNAQ